MPAISGWNNLYVEKFSFRKGQAFHGEEKMAHGIRFNQNIIVGPQPTEAEIRELASKGIKGVINLRTEHEEDQPLSPEREGEIVRQAGMAYVHFPVTMARAKMKLVDRFRSELDSIPKPVFVHCKVGKRAGAFVLMDIAAKQDLSAEEAIQKAESLGFECEPVRLREFVDSYLERERESSLADTGRRSPIPRPHPVGG